jgi:hypothetical protein
MIDFEVVGQQGGFATPLGYSGDFEVGPPILLGGESVAGLAISVSDVESATEQVTVRIPMAIRVSDDTPATEFVRVTPNPLFVNVNDEDAAAEHVVVSVAAGVVVSVFETGAPTEFVQLTLNPLFINVDDTTGAAEAVTVALPMRITVSDSDSPSDAVIVRVGLTVAVSDTDSPTEEVTVQLPMRAVVSDTDAAAEQVTLLLNPLLLNVSDADTPTEFVNAAPPVAINIADRDIVEDKDVTTVTIPMRIVIETPTEGVEDINVTLGRQINVYDQQQGFEVVSLAQSLSVDVSDADSAGEFVAVTSVAPQNISVFDTDAAAEQVTVRFGQPIVVNDVRSAGEDVRLLVGRQHPNVFDSRLPTESVRLQLSRLVIDVSDSDPPIDVVRMPFTVAPPPPTPAGGYAPTWLFDARQVPGTGMEPLELLLASRDIEQLDPPYRGRLIEEPVVNRELMDTFWGFTEVSEITIKIANHDRRLVLLYRADPRDQPVILRRFDTRTLEVTDELFARVTGVALETGAIVLTASSPQLGVFERLVPGPLVTEAQFPRAVDLGAVIPVVFGNVTKMPLPYVNREANNNAFDFLVGHGALTVTAVYSVRQDGGYTLIPTSDYVISTQAYAGLTVIRFATRRVDADGRDVRVVADVSGASRNVIRNIQALLSDSVWGLKQPIDEASFDTAASQIDALGLFCDGALLEARQAQDILRNMMIFRGIRLAFTSTGAWTPTVDTEKTTIDLALGDGREDGVRNILSAGQRDRPSTGDVIATYTLAYRQDFVRGEYGFRQSRTVNPNFGRERTIENDFIRDHATADKIIDYLAKRERFGAETVDLMIPQEGRKLLEGNLVEVTYPPMALNAAVMEVRRVIKRLNTVSILASGWSPDIYVYTPGTLPFDPSEFTGPITIPAPGGLTQQLVDCDFVVTWQPVAEVILGGDEDNLVPLVVKDYQVEVFVNGVLRRTEFTTSTTYTYTLDKNKIDNPPFGSRTVEFVVRARTFEGTVGDPNSTGGEAPPPAMAQITISVWDEPNINLGNEETNLDPENPTAPGIGSVRDYVAISRGPIEVRDSATPTESVQLVLSARRISVNSPIDGSNGSMRTGHDFVTIEFGGLKKVSVVEDDRDIDNMEFVQLDFGPGRIIRVYDDAQPEADLLQDGVLSNIQLSTVSISVSDRPGAFGTGITESRTIARSPLLMNVSDTRTTTESVTIRRSPLLINVSDTRTVNEARTVVRA